MEEKSTSNQIESMKNLKSELKPIEDRVYEIESGYGA